MIVSADPNTKQEEGLLITWLLSESSLPDKGNVAEDVGAWSLVQLLLWGSEAKLFIAKTTQQHHLCVVPSVLAVAAVTVQTR